MNCPICNGKEISAPPMTLTAPPVLECGECGWRGDVDEVNNE